MFVRIFSLAVALVAVSGVVAEAQTSTTSPRPIYGRCIFPSSRILSSVISEELKGAYQRAGYKTSWVVVKVIEQRPPATKMTLGNVVGFQAAIPSPSNPTAVEIYANKDGVPVEMPCLEDVQIQTTVYLTDASGKQTQGTSTSTIQVAGTFN